jgi:DNA mismatch repair protein MutH
LLARAGALSGLCVHELALRAGVALPGSPRRAKGFVGALIERALGAVAGSTAAPDFPVLGVELKTIPLDRQGRPRESTFVCTIALRSMAEAEWESSHVRRKLQRVLWIPIESEPQIAPADRRIGAPRLWSPTAEQEADLRADFEELAGRIGRGEVELVSARIGRCLQVRPKAANARVTVRGADEHGAPLRVAPRAFYLRRSFTATIFAAHAGDSSRAAQHLL